MAVVSKYKKGAYFATAIPVLMTFATPTIDNINGKDVYISYRNFPRNDSILTYDRVMLGESLIDHDKLRFNYHFRNIK